MKTGLPAGQFLELTEPLSHFTLSVYSACNQWIDVYKYLHRNSKLFTDIFVSRDHSMAWINHEWIRWALRIFGCSFIITNSIYRSAAYNIHLSFAIPVKCATILWCHATPVKKLTLLLLNTITSCQIHSAFEIKWSVHALFNCFMKHNFRM